jgi:hypothetical protein
VCSITLVPKYTVLICPWCYNLQMNNVEDYIPDSEDCDTITEDCIVCGRSISIRPASSKKYKVWRTV